MNNKKYYLFILPYLLITFMFELIPLISIFVLGLKYNSKYPSMGNFIEIFTSKYFTQSILNSVKIATITSVVGVIVALIISNSLSKVDFKLKDKIISILNVSSNFQGIQLAFAFIILLGNSGFILMFLEKLGVGFLRDFTIYSSIGIILVFIYFQIPLASLLMYPAFDLVKKEYIESAELLKASKIQIWLRIYIPLLFPSILGVFTVLFCNAIAAYATPFALLSNNYPLLATRISTMFVGDGVPKPEIGSSLSLIMIFIIGMMILVKNLIIKIVRKDVRIEKQQK